jgi:hypothetical protein
MYLKDLGMKFVATALLAVALALATDAFPGKADAGPCWPSTCGTAVVSPFPNDSYGGGRGCTNCSGDGKTLSYCHEADYVWNFCWADNCCRGTSTVLKNGSACYCIPISTGPCNCTGF